MSFTINEDQLNEIVAESIRATLSALGIKPGELRPWISQNEAFRLAGRRTVERAMAEGKVNFRKRQPEKRNSKVEVLRGDIIRLIKNRTI